MALLYPHYHGFYGNSPWEDGGKMKGLMMLFMMFHDVIHGLLLKMVMYPIVRIFEMGYSITLWLFGHGKSPIEIDDFPSYKPPFIVDFAWQCSINRW